MDLFCQRCGEPYETDYVNFEMLYSEKVAFLAGTNCPSCKGKEVKERPAIAEAAAAIADLFGDECLNLRFEDRAARVYVMYTSLLIP